MDSEQTKLEIIHNAGFFSCSTIALEDIVRYYQAHGCLPDIVDRTRQYQFYKNEPKDLIPYYFEESYLDKVIFPWEVKKPQITKEKDVDVQYSDFKKLDFKNVKPFIDRFFLPSLGVQNWRDFYIEKYKIDLENTCAVFYRGNDKNRETMIAPYEAFIEKADEIFYANPSIKFLIQPDETEFLEAFIKEFPDNTIYFTETPNLKRQDSAMFWELPIPERAEFGKKFFAAVLVLSQCKFLITHSGNCGLWSVLYRGNAKNVKQWLIDKWI